MGLFGRKKNAEDFYRGDAPVSAPGIDGDAPGAYQSETGGSTTSAARWAAASGAPAGYLGGYQQPGPPVGQPAAPPTAGPAAPPNVGPATPPNGGQAAPTNGELVDMVSQVFQQSTGQMFGPAQGQQGQAGARVIAGHGLDPATAARVQAALAKRPGVSKLGCLLIAIPVIGALVGVGFAIFAAVKGVTATTDIVGGLTAAPGGSAAVPGGNGAGTVEIGKPVTITTADASYRITVYGAELQRGDGWGYDGANAEPVLIVGAEITRTDPGQEPVEFTGWNWSVTGDDGKPVTGDIISHFAPSLDGPELIGGESVRGFVSFATSVTDVALTVAERPYGPALAAWHLSASTPRVVVGEIGTPAQGEISRPGFTVTAGRPEVVTADDERVGSRPASGQYLVVPVTFTGIPYMEGSIGNVDSSRLVFVSADAKKTDAPLVSTFSGLDGASSFFPVSADAPTSGVLAFDTASVKGELQLRGEADQPIITWQIAAG